MSILFIIFEIHGGFPHGQTPLRRPRTRMPRNLLFALLVCAGLDCVLNIELDGFV